MTRRTIPGHEFPAYLALGWVLVRECPRLHGPDWVLVEARTGTETP